MSRPANTKFTEARTRSNAAPSARMASSLRKRVSSQLFIPSGITLEILLDIVILKRTSVRAIGVLPKFSSPSSWRARSTEVLITLCAFLEVQRAYTMMIPAPKRKYQGVLAGPRSEDIRKPSGELPAPLVVKSMKEEYPAKGTPMKFTRSLPAKARARAKVPNKTTTLNTLILSQCSTCMSIVKNIKQKPISITVLSCIHCLLSGVMNELSFKPFISMK